MTTDKPVIGNSQDIVVDTGHGMLMWETKVVEAWGLASSIKSAGSYLVQFDIYFFVISQSPPDLASG